MERSYLPSSTPGLTLERSAARPGRRPRRSAQEVRGRDLKEFGRKEEPSVIEVWPSDLSVPHRPCHATVAAVGPYPQYTVDEFHVIAG